MRRGRGAGRALGEAGRAFVVPRRAGEPPGERELLEFLRSRLARYKVPASVRFVDELPLSPQGKVLKRCGEADRVTRDGQGG